MLLQTSKHNNRKTNKKETISQTTHINIYEIHLIRLAGQHTRHSKPIISKLQWTSCLLIVYPQSEMDPDFLQNKGKDPIPSQISPWSHLV